MIKPLVGSRPRLQTMVSKYHFLLGGTWVSQEKCPIQGLEQEMSGSPGVTAEGGRPLGLGTEDTGANLRAPAGRHGTRSSGRVLAGMFCIDRACSDQIILKATATSPRIPFGGDRGRGRKTHYYFEELWHLSYRYWPSG